MRGFWHEVTRNSSRLHEVLEVKEKGLRHVRTHCGIRVHALRELNLTRNLEYVLGAPVFAMPEQTTCPSSASGEGGHSPGFGISHVT